MTKEIIITPPPQFILGGPYTTCTATAVTLAAQPTNFDPAQATYLWEFNGQPVGSAATLQPQEFGTYTLTVTVNGCSASQNADVVQQTIAATFSEGCGDNGYALSVAPVEGSFNEATAVYSWAGPDGFSGNGHHVIISEEGEYTLTLTTAEGCVVTHVFDVADASCTDFIIPKGVSPNGDGWNDVFDLTLLEVAKLNVFNRYGLEVFSHGNYTTQWYGQTNNGALLPDGTYYYNIQKTDGQNITGWVYVNRENR
jgi:gliding motility-associated-like protein